MRCRCPNALIKPLVQRNKQGGTENISNGTIAKLMLINICDNHGPLCLAQYGIRNEYIPYSAKLRVINVNLIRQVAWIAW